MNQPDVPIAGLYKMRLVSKGPFVAVKLYFGPPPDPHQPDAPPLDRSPRWMTWINGEERDSVWDAWPSCSGQPINQAEYDFMIKMKDHAEKYEPGLPQANPRQRIDLSRIPPVY